MLKCASFSICSLVTKLLNECIRTSRFPEIWKCSKVTALFKSGDQTNASTYRPISILSTRSKILERAVHSQLYDYLNTNHLLTDKQFGFRPNHSMVTALISFAVDVLKHGALESLSSCILGFVKGFRDCGLQYPARQVIFLGIKSWCCSVVSILPQSQEADHLMRQRDLRSSICYLWCTTREHPGALTFPCLHIWLAYCCQWL